MVEAWHRPMATPAPRDDAGRPQLVLEILNAGDRIAVAPQRNDGGWRAYDIDRLAHRCRDTRTGEEYPLDADMLDLAYQIQVHFKSEAIRVISCYRAPKAASRSNHGRGRAIDIVVPGAKDDEVAAFARTRGFVGVGLYPTSGFVHVDVRPESYSWIDRSGPGQSSREQGTLATEAAASDARARSAGIKPHTQWKEPSDDVASAWGSGPSVEAPLVDPEDPEDDLEEEP